MDHPSLPIKAEACRTTGGQAIMTAREWHSALRRLTPFQPRFDSPYQVARFDDTPLSLTQPALLDDVICLHRGGVKKVERAYAHRRDTHVVQDNALTLMPRWQENQWTTTGPNEYVHLVVSPKKLDEISLAEFGYSRDRFVLYDDVGFRHPLAEHLAIELIYLFDSDEESRLYREGVFTSFVLALLRTHSSLGTRIEGNGGAIRESAGGLPAWRLRKIIDFLHHNRAQSIGYNDLIELADVSRSHFFRAFRTSTGMTPGRYLEQLRVSYARSTLEKGGSIDEAMQNSGFEHVRSMSRAFQRHLGLTPAQYRRWYR